MKINFNEVKALELLPNGKYLAHFVNAVEKPNNAGDGLNVNTTFDLTGDHQGRKQFKSFSLKEAALWNLKNFILALGMDEDTLNEEDREVVDILKDYYGVEVVLEITNSIYNGNPVNNVKNVLDASNQDWS